MIDAIFITCADRRHVDLKQQVSFDVQSIMRHHCFLDNLRRTGHHVWSSPESLANPRESASRDARLDRMFPENFWSDGVV